MNLYPFLLYFRLSESNDDFGAGQCVLQPRAESLRRGAPGIRGVCPQDEPLKIPWLIDCYSGLYYLVYWGS
jgi:hypothetical protein